MPPSIRHDWIHSEVSALYTRPLLDLVLDAQITHRQHHDPHEIQRAALLSIKTGGCSENCGYCSQSARHDTAVDAEPLLAVDEVLAHAQRAKEGGASRFCMGAAWRGVKSGRSFDKVLEMVRGVAAMDLEVCCTLGMIDEEQAVRLKQAGLTAYNHNLDTSPEYYDRIVTTRTYQDRLDTLAAVAKAGISACCGGIIGLGESRDDRCSLLQTLSNLDPHPESVPINLLVPIPGTPLHGTPSVDVFELVRTVATARLLMPASRVRLSAGRSSLTREAQALCFMAGANSIFFGENLLTTPNRTEDEDTALLADLGLSTR